MTDATLERESQLAAHGARFIGGVDEVGRGALAGPVFVGVVIVDMQRADELIGLRDSKLLTAKQRAALVPRIHEWCQRWSIGQAGNDEIDERGIVAALSIAANRAFDQLVDDRIDAVILDGSVDWVSGIRDCAVHVEPRADLRCASVAAASVLAKVARDALMTALHDEVPHYAWNANKGYGSAAHMAALRSHGASAWHRRSWRLPEPAQHA
jgi:ribonuclease HII